MQGVLSQQFVLKSSVPGLRQDQRAVVLCKWASRLCAVALAIAYNWVNRFSMNVDGISYLDMAYAYMRGDWKIAVNAYWGAGYAWLLGVFLVPFHVPPRWESSVVHLVNVLIFIVALVSFEYFLRGVIELRHKVSFSAGQISFTDWSWWVLGYLLFTATNVFITPVTIVTPDLCVESIVLLASGIIVRIAAGRTDARIHVALGVILGIGYLIKSPMLPMGLVYLAVAWLAAPRARRVPWRVALSLTIFLLISGPYIVAISRAVGRPTIGENARITYAHYALGINDFSYWQGQFPGAGTPRHSDATRKLMSAPDVYEFDTSTGGTLPPYYNPAYWASGLITPMNWRGQLSVLKDSAQRLLDVIFFFREFVLAFLVLLLLQQGASAFLRRCLACWPIWLPALVAVAMYAPVHIELRFLGGYILLLWAGISFSLEFPEGLFTHRLYRAVSLALVTLVGYHLVSLPTGPFWRQPVPPEQWSVAQSLLQHGIHPGDRMAQMLFHTRDFHYWAHLAGVVIAAEVPYEEEGEFWASSPEVQRRVEDILRQTGAKALVTEDLPSLPASSGWESIPGTDYGVLFLTPR
jgi:hypothetical protein